MRGNFETPPSRLGWRRQARAQVAARIRRSVATVVAIARSTLDRLCGPPGVLYLVPIALAVWHGGARQAFSWRARGGVLVGKLPGIAWLFDVRVFLLGRRHDGHHLRRLCRAAPTPAARAGAGGLPLRARARRAPCVRLRRRPGERRRALREPQPPERLHGRNPATVGPGHRIPAARRKAPLRLRRRARSPRRWTTPRCRIPRAAATTAQAGDSLVRRATARLHVLRSLGTAEAERLRRQRDEAPSLGPHGRPAELAVPSPTR